MRRDEICEWRILAKRLRVVVNGRATIDESVRAAGAREDWPLYVFRALAIPPGEHIVEVEWSTEVGPSAARQSLAVRIRVEPAEIVLFTYGLDRRVLVGRGADLLDKADDSAS